MRKLNKKQKRLLKDYADHSFSNGADFVDINDLPTDLYHEIMQLNDHETFYQNANRFLIDYSFNRRINKDDIILN